MYPGKFARAIAALKLRDVQKKIRKAPVLGLGALLALAVPFIPSVGGL